MAFLIPRKECQFRYRDRSRAAPQNFRVAVASYFVARLHSMSCVGAQPLVDLTLWPSSRALLVVAVRHEKKEKQIGVRKLDKAYEITGRLKTKVTSTWNASL